MFELTPITADFTIEVDASEPFKISDTLQKEVDDEWNEACALQDLTNDPVLNLISMQKNRLIGHFIEYKYVAACSRSEKLRSQLNVCPVGMSGITKSGTSLLIAKRTSRVLLFPQCYELAPSGTVDDRFVHDGVVNLEESIADELVEETGIEKQMILDVEPFLVAHDLKNSIIDVCLHINVSEEAKMMTHSTEEYIDLRWIEEGEIHDVAGGDEWMPLSVELCQFIRAL